MPRKKTIEELIEQEQQKREAINARLAKLAKQAADAEKAKREKRERQMGRLAYQAGLAELPDETLAAGFQRLAAHAARSATGTAAAADNSAST